MIRKEFMDTIKNNQPPDGINTPLKGLWWDGKGDWDQAHKIVQDDNSPEASWVHAYLHRKEGSIGNAAYWYSRVGQDMSTLDSKKEWEQIVEALLK